LVELVPYNLVTYSEQFDNAAWNKNSDGVLITSNATTAPNGTLTADQVENNPSSPNTPWMLQFFNALVGGQTYTYSIYVRATTSATKQLGIWNNSTSWTYQNISVTTEWQRFEFSFVANASATQWAIGLEFNGAETAYFIWGAQLNEGSVAKDYQKTETRLNIPRLDYSLGGCPNILLEPQRTNLTTYSEQFDDASWNKINSSVTANADISPDGYTNADRIYDNATSGQHRVGKNISVVSATTYTFSVFAKKGSLRYCYLFTVAGGASDRYYFDLQDGVSITAGGKIEDYGSGWYRISAQVTAAATGNELFAFNLTNSSSSPTYSGTGTGYHMIYGYQVEAGDYATSYIPTTTASVTRNTDVISKTGISSLIGQTEGTIYLEADIQKHNDSEFYIAISNGQSLGEAIYLQQPSSGNLNILFRTSGLTTTITVSSANWNIGFNKIAIAYNSTSGEVFINGASKGTVALTALPTCSQLTLGARPDAPGSLVGSGGYKVATLWKERLTNDQLAQLTTI
jgi:hypothetical protein